jgi:transcriptional regulator with XRE-family HTH domain
MEFGELVKSVREQVGLTQVGLAEALGVSFPTVNYWENGRSKPSKLGVRTFKNFCESRIDQGKITQHVEEIENL